MRIILFELSPHVCGCHRLNIMAMIPFLYTVMYTKVCLRRGLKLLAIFVFINIYNT